MHNSDIFSCFALFFIKDSCIYPYLSLVFSYLFRNIFFIVLIYWYFCLYRKKKSSIMARITIPHAVTDFADLRERGFYYVDKTNYIPGLEDYNAPVFLRPRRFGKSLLISSWLTTTTVQRRIVLKNSSAVPGLANILRKSIINIL